MITMIVDYLGENPCDISGVEQILWDDWIMTFDLQDGHNKVPGEPFFTWDN